MSDALRFTPAPEAGLAGPDLARLVADYKPTSGQFLGAQVASGFGDSLAGLALQQGRVERAALDADGADAQPLPRETWQASDTYREGLTWEPGWTPARARAMAEIFDERQTRAALIARRDAGALETVAGFGAAILGGLATPENFIPFAGPALNIARAQRFSSALRAGAARVESMAVGGIGARAGAGAITGAFDGALGNAAVMPLTVPMREHFGDEITWADMVQDLAFGAAGGAVLGSAFGAVLGRNLAAKPVAEQDAALRTLAGTADQVARGEDPDLSLLDPDARAELIRSRQELARLQAMLEPDTSGGGTRSNAAANRAPAGATEARPGAVARVTTPAGQDVQVRYEVIDAADLIPSNTLPDYTVNPAFPPELQPRDRSQPEAQQQVIRISTELRPEELAGNTSTVSGAPIVGPDGVVESGNGRTLAILRAYQEALPTAAAYRAFLLRAGFDEAAQMAQPVLIRRRTTELDMQQRVRLADDSNTSQIKELTPSERASADARRLTPDVIGRLRPGAIDSVENADFLRAFVNSLPPSEQGSISRDGALTQAGYSRVMAALAGRAYGSPALIARLVEARDDAGAALGRALMDAAPTLARLRAAIEAGAVRPELDAVPALVRAVERIQAARDADRPLRSVLDQADAFDRPSPAEQAMLELLLRHPVRDAIGGVGRETLTARLEAYARAAADAPTAPDMFGSPPPGLGDVLRAAYREAGIDAPAALRGLDADSYSPPPPEAAPPMPPPPEPAAATGNPVAAAAARTGLDVDATFALAEVERLRAAGLLPPDIAQALADADAMAAKVANPETFDAAMACAIRG